MSCSVHNVKEMTETSRHLAVVSGCGCFRPSCLGQWFWLSLRAFFLIDVLFFFTSVSVHTLQSGKTIRTHFTPSCTHCPTLVQHHSPLFPSDVCWDILKRMYMFGQEIGYKISKPFLSFYVFSHLVQKQQIHLSWRGSKSF